MIIHSLISDSIVFNSTIEQIYANSEDKVENKGLGKIFTFNPLEDKVHILVDKILSASSYIAHRTSLNNKTIPGFKRFKLNLLNNQGERDREVGMWGKEARKNSNQLEIMITKKNLSHLSEHHFSTQPSDIIQLIFSFLSPFQKEKMKGINKEMGAHAAKSIRQMNQMEIILIEKQSLKNRDFLLKNLFVFQKGTFVSIGISGILILDDHGAIEALIGADTGYLPMDNVTQKLGERLRIPSLIGKAAFDFILDYTWNPDTHPIGPFSYKARGITTSFLHTEVMKRVITHLNTKALEAWKTTTHAGHIQNYVGPAWLKNFI